MYKHIYKYLHLHKHIYHNSYSHLIPMSKEYYSKRQIYPQLQFPPQISSTLSILKLAAGRS